MGTQGHEAENWEDIAAVSEAIGHNVVIRYYRTSESDKAGLLLYHRHADGSICGGSVAFDVPGNPTERPRWKVENWEPLTLSPSIEDKTCSEGLHGYIRNGRWEPC
jgi:hypothetical protein